MAKRRGNCSCTPRRRGPMTVHVKTYRRSDGTRVNGHRRHRPS
ncbi:hypothetical protein [Alkalibacillus haloalkaliphilus]|nr:hypothetical protein [Alkalibacillus haloalkaliphilus]